MAIDTIILVLSQRVVRIGVEVKCSSGLIVSSTMGYFIFWRSLLIFTDFMSIICLLISYQCLPNIYQKCGLCLHNLHFMKTRYFLPDFPKVASAVLSCFHQVKNHCFKNKWILRKFPVIFQFIRWFSATIGNYESTNFSRIWVCLSFLLIYCWYK